MGISLVCQKLLRGGGGGQPLVVNLLRILDERSPVFVAAVSICFSFRVERRDSHSPCSTFQRPVESQDP